MAWSRTACVCWGSLPKLPIWGGLGCWVFHSHRLFYPSPPELISKSDGYKFSPGGQLASIMSTGDANFRSSLLTEADFDEHGVDERDRAKIQKYSVNSFSRSTKLNGFKQKKNLMRRPRLKSEIEVNPKAVERGYKCPVDGCNRNAKRRGFFQWYNLRQHLRSKHDWETYKTSA